MANPFRRKKGKKIVKRVCMVPDPNDPDTAHIFDMHDPRKSLEDAMNYAREGGKYDTVIVSDLYADGTTATREVTVKAGIPDF